MTSVIERDPPTAGPRTAARRLPVLLGLALAVVAVAVWIVAFSPVLGVRTVTVTGTRALTAGEVRAAAQIGSGTPLIRLDTAAVRRRVEALAGVADAEVRVSYPSTVLIKVTERSAVGYVLAPSGGYALVDRFGVQYRHLGSAPAALPRFSLPAGSAAVATGQAVATVAAALSPALLSTLVEIRAASPSSITLVLRDGRSVAWGSADRSDAKARLLPALLAQPGDHYDVSNPDVVVAR